MFKDAKIGDRVWGMRYGWGVVRSINLKSVYPVVVYFDEQENPVSFMFNGKYALTDLLPTLFWDEVKFDIPQKPLPKKYLDLIIG